MSYASRPAVKLYRWAAVALLGAFAALPFAAAPASAQDGPQVKFSGGGLGVLLCGSRPDVSRITVGEDSKVRLTNQLGMAATLTIDGSSSASIANGDSVDVQFHHGPVVIGMEPSCALNLNRKFEQLTVDVNADGPTPRPSQSSVAQRPPTRPIPPPPTAAGTDDEGGLPPSAGDPLFPELDEGALGGIDPSTGARLDASATVVNGEGSNDGNADPRLAAGGGPVDKGPIGLLAIVATVCVVGVSIGAIRVIITQRASRTEYA